MPPKKKPHPYKRRTKMTPKKITSSYSLIDLCDSPPPPCSSSLETAELIKISPLEVDTSHEVSISRVPNPNFIAPPVPRPVFNLPRLLSPTLNPSFSQPPRISTRTFTTLVRPTDNVPTVLYSHPWNSNSNLPSFVSSNPYRCSTFPNPLFSPLPLLQPASSGHTWINPYEPNSSLGSFNHCHQVKYTSTNPRIECAGYVNRYLSFFIHILKLDFS